MNTTKKPRLCELLGLEVAQRFQVKSEERGVDFTGLYINGEGKLGSAETLLTDADLRHALEEIIEYPESVIAAPRWDEDEMEFLHSLYKAGVKEAVSKKANERVEGKRLYLYWLNGDCTTWYIPDHLLPHLQHQETVTLADLFKDEPRSVGEEASA